MASSDAIDRWLPLLVRGEDPLAAREKQNLAYSISCWNDKENRLIIRRFFCVLIYWDKLTSIHHATFRHISSSNRRLAIKHERIEIISFRVW